MDALTVDGDESLSFGNSIEGSELELQPVLDESPEKVLEEPARDSLIQVWEEQNREHEDAGERSAALKQTSRRTTRVRNTPQHLEHFIKAALEYLETMVEAMQSSDEEQW